jgi:hypothetical protein
MPLKLRKISFEYHFAFLSPTHVDFLLCPTGRARSSNLVRTSIRTSNALIFLNVSRSSIEASNVVATMASAAKKLVVGSEAAERVEEPLSVDEHTEERICTTEKATKEDDSVDSSRFCIHCGENPCFVDTMFDAAESYCDCLGEECDRPLKMVWQAKALRRYFYECWTVIKHKLLLRVY